MNIDPLSHHPSRMPIKVVLISCGAAIGGFLFGFDTAVINGAIDPIKEVFGLSSFGVGAVVAITLFGAAFGAFATGWLADRCGRTRVMSLASLLFVASSIGCGISTGYYELTTWRFVVGFSVGITTVIGPLYLSEIAPAAVRGRLSSLQQMAIVLGIFAALLSNTLIARVLNGANAGLWLGLPAWRWMFLIGLIPSVLYGIFSLLIPDSPRYLVSREKMESAKSVLMTSQNITADAAQEQAERIQATLQLTHRPQFRVLLDKKTGLLPIVWVGIALAALQALVGIDVIFYYSTSLWKSVGFDESTSFELSVLSSFVNILATVVAIVLIDKVGRRKLLLFGSAGMFFSLLTVSFGFSMAQHVAEDAIVLPAPWGGITLAAANCYQRCKTDPPQRLKIDPGVNLLL
jgi:SP family sugar:H+ symporter-like MFS transporter